MFISIQLSEMNGSLRVKQNKSNASWLNRKIQHQDGESSIAKQ